MAAPISSEDEEIAHLRFVFERDGYICRQDILPVDCVKEWGTYSESIVRKIFEKLHKNGHSKFPLPYRLSQNGESKVCQKEYALGLGVKHGFKEIVMRSPGRYEISLRPSSICLGEKIPPLDNLLNGPLSFIPSFLDASSWSEVQICHISLVISYPGSDDQGWHADGGHVNIQKHLPCHCFNIFIPLSDVTKEMGPTEIRPGTHYHTRNLAPMMLAARARKTLRSPQMPPLAVGDILAFDYRILHRGRANTSEKDRSILVLTVAKKWFKDVLNFPSRSLQEPTSSAVASTS